MKDRKGIREKREGENETERKEKRDVEYSEDSLGGERGRGRGGKRGETT